MKKIIFLSLMFALLSFSPLQINGQIMQNKHTVIVILKAKPGCEDLLKKELLIIKKLSEQEEACINYHIHEDVQNPARIILYENWINKEEHAKQFTKTYIIEFGKKLSDLIAKPYEATIAKEIN